MVAASREIGSSSSAKVGITAGPGAVVVVVAAAVVVVVAGAVVVAAAVVDVVVDVAKTLGEPLHAGRAIKAQAARAAAHRGAARTFFLLRRHRRAYRGVGPPRTGSAGLRGWRTIIPGGTCLLPET
ncbi:MAG: hypothetical protein H6Q11_1498 [Acidobacteria bacterium]|nr:hypothetical protein [Acidobacteriota bacterium]